MTTTIEFLERTGRSPIVIEPNGIWTDPESPLFQVIDCGDHAILVREGITVSNETVCGTDESREEWDLASGWKSVTHTSPTT